MLIIMFTHFLYAASTGLSTGAIAAIAVVVIVLIFLAIVIVIVVVIILMISPKGEINYGYVVKLCCIRHAPLPPPSSKWETVIFPYHLGLI